MNRYSRKIGILVGGLLLAGCSGGDDPGPVGGPLPPVAAPAVITSANAPMITGAVVNSAFEVGDLGSLFGSGPIVSAARVEQQGVAATGELVRQARLGLLDSSQMDPCAVSGTVTVTTVLSNPLTITPGDTITMVFAACDEGDGSVVTGTLALTVTSFSGDIQSGLFALGVSMRVTGFSVTENAETVLASGDLTLMIDLTTPMVVSISISATAFTITEGGESVTMVGFLLAQTFDESMVPSAFTATVAGTISSTEFGSVSFITTIDLQGSGQEFAFSGEIVITGADGASITMIPLDNVNVRLQIDLDGDNATDDTIDTTWAALTS